MLIKSKFHLISRCTLFILLMAFWVSRLSAEESAYHVIHQKGLITTLEPNDPFPQKSELGYEFKVPFKIFTPDFSELVLLQTTVGELQLAGLSNLDLLKDQAQIRHLSLSKGYLALNLFKENTLAHTIAVPHGKIEWMVGNAIIEVRTDDSALVSAEQEQLTITHRRGETKLLKTGESIVIDRFGFKPVHTDLEKIRVIFDFSRKPEQEKKLLAQAPKPKKTPHASTEEKKAQASSPTAKSKKVAKDAKITSGEGNGEGEYKWSLGPNLLVILAPILLLAAWLVFLRLKKAKQAQAELEETTKHKTNAKDEYHAEDVFVIRENLTSNDPKLITTKTTHILGNVEDGATIEASHKLLIKGSFQAAKLISTHGVTIESGINGSGKADLQIVGDLKTSYISEANILCLGTVKVDQAIRNSKIAAEGLIKVERKDIIGGLVASRTGIECQTLGSDFGETEIQLGNHAQVIWTDHLQRELLLKHETLPPKGELNQKAAVRIFSEINNTKLNLGTTKLDQKKHLPGPIESHYEFSDGGKLVFRGFKKEDA